MFKQQIVWLTIVVGILACSVNGVAAGFCDDLMSIFLRSEKLSDLAGRPIRGSSWQAIKGVSGFASCRIWRLPDTSIVFSCETPRKRSLPSVKRDYSRVEMDIISCLKAPPWEHDAYESQLDPLPRRSFRLRSSELSAMISVDDGTDDTPEMADIWYVNLTIYEIEK